MDFSLGRSRRARPRGGRADRARRKGRGQALLREGMSRALAVLLALMSSAALMSASAWATPIAVRYPESITHAFLTLRGPNGDVLAHGELVQAPVEGQRVESRLVFRFKDGSLWDDKVIYTQQKVFRVMSYHHVERGPSFPEAIDASFDRDTGRYRAKVDDKTDEGA